MEEILYNPHTMEDAGDMVDHVSQHYVIPLSADAVITNTMRAAAEP